MGSPPKLRYQYTWIKYLHSKMEGQNSQHGQIIETNVDVLDGGGNLTGSKICGEAPCVFSDAGTNSKDAKERSDSIRKPRWESTPHQTYGFFRVETLGDLVSIQLIWLFEVILVYKAIVGHINDTKEVDGFLMFLFAAFGLVVNIIVVFVFGHDHGHSHGHDDHGHGIGHSHGMRISSDHYHHAEISEGEHNHHHHEEIPKAEDHHHGVEHSQDKHDHHHCGVEHSHDEQHHSAEVHTEPLLDKPKDGHEQKKRRNIYLRVLGDFIQSIGVMIGGAVIWYKPEWKIVDVICTLIFSVSVLGNTIKRLRSILEVLMESTPREIDATKLEKGLLEMEEVVHIHELHIWAITEGKVLLACHVKIRPEANADMVLDNVVNYIRREYNISHVTVQIER
ncbi:hypothetical protein LWI29_002861 [Acer saccharum]|uniref:Uncharacterized protein n=1 Tax=Acer saccharum TaxID=4024 RepID=A0AA39RSS0_ACESA|nr:hypothetical protein LWI29_002861 [Acer saccharum]